MQITVGKVLRLLVEADMHPRQSNEDWRDADRLEAEALMLAASALDAPGDPPEFRQWLDALREPSLRLEEREDIYVAIKDRLDRCGADL